LFVKGYELAPGEAASKKPVGNEVSFKYVSQTNGNTGPGTGNTVKDKLETDKHIRYIAGYPDGSLGPDLVITRAEVAMIFFRLVKDPAKESVIRGTFTDVKDGVWYTQAVNYLAKIGVILGYPDGSFRPENNLTRGEIVTVINRMLLRGIEVQDLPRWAPTYTDITAAHWAYTAIMEASIGHEFTRKVEGEVPERWTRRLSWSPVLES